MHTQIGSHQNIEYETHHPKPQHSLQFKFKITKVKQIDLPIFFFVPYGLVDWVPLPMQFRRTFTMLMHIGNI